MFRREVMSEYLGWTNKGAPRERFDRDIIPGGPETASYEAYVRSVFQPGREHFKGSGATANPSRISASTMLRMENELGKHALDDSNDLHLLNVSSDPFAQSPLDALYAELGLSNPKPSKHSSYNNYQVYNPKQSSEYNSIAYSLPSGKNNDSAGKGSYSSFRERFDNEWKKTNKQMLVDYKDFSSSPLSPYMYQNHPYVQKQDTRIIGSNFVQLTTRPRDAFLEKIDRTLAEVRAMPRY